MDRPSLSVIVPCYNEAESLEEASRRIKAVLVECVGASHEILFVDDGSTDGTPGVLAGLAAADSRVVVIRLSRNFGKEAALSAGIAHCRGELAALIDADLQDPPELLSGMLELRRETGAQIVYGVRRDRSSDRPSRRLAARFFYGLQTLLSESRIPSQVADFCLIDRSVIDAFALFGERQKYTRGLLFWTGFDRVPFYYDRGARETGHSRFGPAMLFRLAGTGLIYFSRKPLQLIIVLGLFCLLVGLALIAWMIFSVISRRAEPAPGWASIITAVVFFSGVQLLTLGVLGGYIGNIFEEVKRRPQYIVRQRINYPGDPADRPGPPE